MSTEGLSSNLSHSGIPADPNFSGTQDTNNINKTNSQGTSTSEKVENREGVFSGYKVVSKALSKFEKAIENYFFQTVGSKREFKFSYKAVVSNAVLELKHENYKSASTISKFGQQLFHRTKLFFATAGEIAFIAVKFFPSIGIKMAKGVATSFYETKAKLFQIGSSNEPMAVKVAKTFAEVAKAPFSMIYKAVTYGIQATLSNVGQVLVFTVSGLSGVLAGVEKFDNIESRGRQERGVGSALESALLIVPKWFQAFSITKNEVFRTNTKNMTLLKKIEHYTTGIFKFSFKMLGQTLRVAATPLTAIGAALFSKGIPSLHKDLSDQIDILKKQLELIKKDEFASKDEDALPIIKELNSRIQSLENIAKKSSLDMKDIKKIKEETDEIFSATRSLRLNAQVPSKPLKEIRKIAENLNRKASNEITADKLENYWEEGETKGLALDASMGVSALFQYEKVKGSKNLELAYLGMQREEAIYNLKMAKNLPVPSKNDIEKNLNKIIDQVSPRLLHSAENQFKEVKDQIKAQIAQERNKLMKKNKAVLEAISNQLSVDKKIMKNDENFRKLNARKSPEIVALAKELNNLEAMLAQVESQALINLRKKLFS